MPKKHPSGKVAVLRRINSTLRIRQKENKEWLSEVKCLARFNTLKCFHP
jgi:hypothetical protein